MAGPGGGGRARGPGEPGGGGRPRTALPPPLPAAAADAAPGCGASLGNTPAAGRALTLPVSSLGPRRTAWQPAAATAPECPWPETLLGLARNVRLIQRSSEGFLPGGGEERRAPGSGFEMLLWCRLAGLERACVCVCVALRNNSSRSSCSLFKFGHAPQGQSISRQPF